MAKKNTNVVEVVKVPDLATEFGVKASQVRGVIRKMGITAPKVDNGGKFGPKSRYEWNSDSKELADIRKALGEFAESYVPRQNKPKEGAVTEVEEVGGSR